MAALKTYAKVSKTPTFTHVWQSTGCEQ